MAYYALVNVNTGIVENTVVLDPEHPEEWPPMGDVIAIFYEAPTAVSAGYTYKDGKFIAPEAPPVPPPTDAEIAAANTGILQRSNQLAALQKAALTNRIGTLQDAIDNIGVEGMEDYAATPAEQAEFTKRKTQLTQWKNYAIALGRVTGQAGWALKVTWPTEPKEGMDLGIAPTSAATANASS